MPGSGSSSSSSSSSLFSNQREANLAAIYRRAGDTYRGIAVLERMMIIDPDNTRVEGELRALKRRYEGLN